MAFDKSEITISCALLDNGAFEPLHLTYFNENIYHTADSILIFFCSFAIGNSSAQLKVFNYV